MAKQEPALIEPRLIKALENLVRVEILRVLNQGPNSPARISRQLEGVSLNLVSHHIKVLQESGCIELVETLERNGATEHIYKAVGPRFIDTPEWETVEPRLRQQTTATVLRLISADTSRALQRGTFDELPDSHMSRSTLSLDREGWGEIVDILREALEGILAVDEKSTERIAASGEKTIPARVAILQFVVPGDEDEEDQREDGSVAA